MSETILVGIGIVAGIMVSILALGAAVFGVNWPWLKKKKP